MKIALVGFGNVGRPLARLIERQRHSFPLRIVAIHTAHHGTAYDPDGLPPDPAFGPPAASIDEFLSRAGADVMVELTPLNPATGEPAISHIRAAFARRLHVVTANKGPIAHAYHLLRAEAAHSRVLFRFESTVMDGAPVFNMVRHTLPGVHVLGFTGVLNSTTKIVIEAMRAGKSMEEGIEEAQRLGITEADARFDIDGWDSAAKTAALANVLMDARITPQQVDTRGIARLTPERMAELAAKGKTVRLVSRARRNHEGVKLRVRAEVVEENDILATVRGTSNLLLLHTDLMGTIGTVSIAPTVEQTAYGVFSDLVDVLSSK
ncbi:MAG: homoserine dehydrogenase [Bryobacteraceae bacterium]